MAGEGMEAESVGFFERVESVVVERIFLQSVFVVPSIVQQLTAQQFPAK